MNSYPYSIKVGAANAGQVTVQGRDIAFFNGDGPDEQHSPLHVAAMKHYLATGETSGIVTVSVVGE